jgi:hypothetical protein
MDLKSKKSILLITLSIISILTNEMGSYIFHIKELNYVEMSKRLSTEQINKLLDIQENFKVVNYFVTFFLYVIKTFIISSILYIGAFFYSKVKVTFKQLWQIVVKAEFVFLGIGIFKIIWFYFFQTGFTLEDLQYFYPLSALNIIGYKGLDTWLIYPLQVLNLFEVAYIIYLSYQIGNQTKTNADNGLKIVASSYIPALVLWVCVVMFFTLNYS